MKRNIPEEFVNSGLPAFTSFPGDDELHFSEDPYNAAIADSVWIGGNENSPGVDVILI